MSSTEPKDNQNSGPLEDSDIFNESAWDEDADFSDYVVPDVDPDSVPESQPIEELSTEESIDATFKGMPGYEKLLAHVIDYCEEEKDSQDVLDEIERFSGSAVITYAPGTICANLERAGALCIVEDEQNAAEPAEGADTTAPSDEGTEDEEQGEYREIHPATFKYVASAEGLAAAATVHEQEDFAPLLEGENARYAPVYRILLEGCASESGLTKKEIDSLIDSHPICKSPRRYSGFFIKNLETVGALTFDDTWHATDYGREILASSVLDTDDTDANSDEPGRS